MALTKREMAEKRLTGLKAVRQPYEPEWRQIAGLAQPARSRFLVGTGSKGKGGRTVNNGLQDDYGILSFRTLGNGMQSGLSSSSRPWFISKTADPDLMRDHDAAAWLGLLDQNIYALLWRSSYYDVSKHGYSEMGLFGTEGGFMESDLGDKAVCHAMTAGEFWTALGQDRRPNLMYRRVPLTVFQLVQKFATDPFNRHNVDWSIVAPTVKSLWDAGTYEAVCDVYHAVEENDDYVEGAIGKRGKKFSSVWWDQGDGRKGVTLRDSGYEEQPFWCPRWSVVGSDVYGTGPGSEALPSLRNLQMQSKRKAEATDFVVKPEKVVPASLKGMLKGMPGNNVAAASTDIDKVQVPYLLDYRVINVLGEDIAKITQRLDQLTYANLFMAISQIEGGAYRNVEEIASRNQEALSQLGPVIESASIEKLAVVHNRAMGIVMRSGMMPDPPEQLQGQEVKAEFTSILAQLQQAVGIGQIERSVGFIGQIAAVWPSAIDKVDPDGMVDEYFDRASVPARMRRSDDDVQKVRDQKAQQQKMQQLAATLPAVKDGADAAKLLSEARTTGGQSLLGGLAGMGGA